MSKDMIKNEPECSFWKFELLRRKKHNIFTNIEQNAIEVGVDKQTYINMINNYSELLHKYDPVQTNNYDIVIII